MRGPQPLVAALAIAALAAAGCTGPRERIAARGVVDDPPPRPDRSDLYRETLAAEWPVQTPALEPGGTDNPPLAELEVELDAAAVQVVEVDVRGLERGSLVLIWRRAGAAEGSDPSLLLQAERARTLPGAPLRFDVANDERWSGKIVRLSIFTEAPKRPQVAVSAVRALRWQLDPEGLERTAASPWKLSLGRDLRNGFLLPPGRPWSERFDLPESATLRFSYGLETGARHPVEIVVRAREEGGQPVELLRTPRLGVDLPAGTWHEAAVDLTSLAGRNAWISIEATSVDGAEDPFGLALLANPDITTRLTAPRPANVVLVSIDTLRADHLSSYGYGRPTSPHIDRWAASRAVRFATAIAAAPSTLPSHATMLTGLDAIRHGVHHEALPGGLETLSERLRARGYLTVALTGGGYLDPDLGFAQGFDVYRSWLWGERRTEELESNVDWAVDWLARRPPGPFFLFLHTYEVHPPFHARAPEFRRWNDADPEEPLLWVAAPEAGAANGYRREHPARFEYRTSDPAAPARGEGPAAAAIDRYDSSIAFVDAQLDRLLSALRSAGVENETLVVVTSDHGESFGERGRAGHGYLSQDNLRVPLYVALPDGRGAGRVVERMVRSVDVVPTILEGLGAPSPEGLDGRSLLPLVADSQAPFPGVAWSYASNSNHGLALRRTNGLAILFDNTAWPGAFGERAAFDLEADPDESRPLPPSLEIDALVRTLVGYYAESAPGLRLRLENGSGRDARAIIAAPWLGTTRVKGVTLVPVRAEWLGSGRFAVALAPGETAELQLEGTDARATTLRFSDEARQEVSPLVLPDPAPGAQVARVWSGDTWHETTCDGWSYRVTVTRSGRPRGAAAPAPALSPELEEQLRSLGYLR